MQIKIYSDIKDLTGKGEEWLTDFFGNVIATFQDGNIQCQIFYLSDKEKTKAA